MTTFIEAPRFPDDISYGSRGGPTFATSIIEQDSGSEIRNQHWAYPRHTYDVAYGVTSFARLENLLSYHHIVAGRAIGFRYKDFLDFKSCLISGTPSATNCVIGTGTGSLSTFQLYKTYVQGSYTRSRKILKPVIGTVLIAVNGTPSTDFTVDTTTGIVTFTEGNFPAGGTSITAGFEFDVPVRFDVDALSINIEDYNAGSISIPLIELKFGDV